MDSAQPSAGQGTTLCSLENAWLRYRSRQGLVPALRGVSCRIAPGEIVGITGESGSGKSTLGAILLDQLPAAAGPVEGIVTWRSPRPRTAWIPQEPQAALNPVLAVWLQVAEAVRLPHSQVKGRDRAAAEHLLALAGCPSGVGGSYPHQLSGGLCQRVLIAIALARDAELLVADEPTESLDPTTQAAICTRLRRLAAEHGAALVFISHDLPLVAALAQRLLVMRDGRIVEAGPTARLFRRPEHPETRRLLAALPAAPTRVDPATREAAAARENGRAPLRFPAAPVAELRDVSVRFTRGGREIEALAGVSLDVLPGELYGLVGESGAGKTTLARCLTGLHAPDAGAVSAAGFPVPHALGPEAEREFRRRCRYLPQPARGSLNPRLTVLEHFLEAFAAVEPPAPSLRRGRGWWPARRRPFRPAYRRALALLRQAGLPPELARRYPHQLSGGQARRVGFALAMSSDPRLIVADEPFSGLDLPASVQLLNWLQELVTGGCALVLVSHRLDLVAAAAGRIGVLHQGRLIEEAPTSRLWHQPRQPETQALLAALPKMDPGVGSVP